MKLKAKNTTRSEHLQNLIEKLKNRDKI